MQNRPGSIFPYFFQVFQVLLAWTRPCCIIFHKAYAASNEEVSVGELVGWAYSNCADARTHGCFCGVSLALYPSLQLHMRPEVPRGVSCQACTPWVRLRRKKSNFCPVPPLHRIFKFLCARSSQPSPLHHSLRLDLQFLLQGRDAPWTAERPRERPNRSLAPMM
jgi:hypothetical protein